MAEDKKITVENEDGDSAELGANLASSPEEIKSENNDLNLLADLEKLKAEVAAKNDRILRLQADFDNFRKRMAKEKSEVADVIEQKFLTDLLPLLDNLDRAVVQPNADVDALLKGIALIRQQAYEICYAHALQPIDVAGQKFDHNFHQAVSTVQDETQEDDTITAEFQRGYMARNKVIRPSMVQVVRNA